MNLNLVSSNHSKNVAISTKFQKKDNQGNVVDLVECKTPVEVLFEGLDLNKYFKCIPGFGPLNNSNILNDISEEFCFLFTGHWLPGNFGEDRKNISTLIRTFIETFKGVGKKPALILKTNQVNYSLLDRESILAGINRIRTKYGSKNSANIYLLHG